jgi:hypothetical protein
MDLNRIIQYYFDVPAEMLSGELRIGFDAASENELTNFLETLQSVKSNMIGSHDWDVRHPWNIQVLTPKYGWQYITNGHGTRTQALKRLRQEWPISFPVRVVRVLF